MESLSVWTRTHQPPPSTPRSASLISLPPRLESPLHFEWSKTVSFPPFPDSLRPPPQSIPMPRLFLGPLDSYFLRGSFREYFLRYRAVTPPRTAPTGQFFGEMPFRSRVSPFFSRNDSSLTPPAWEILAPFDVSLCFRAVTFPLQDLLSQELFCPQQQVVER